MRDRWIGLVVLCCVSGCGVAAERPAPSRRAALPAVGAMLDSLLLVDWHTGQRRAVTFPAGGPMALVVFDRSDCVSCLNLVYESWSLARWATGHGGRVVGVVTAPSRGDSLVAAFARESRLPYELLVDTAGFVVRALGTDQLPLVAFVSPAGVVLSVMPRSPQLTETRPIERYLAGLDWRAGP